jgi:hypothetical protein
MATKGYKPAISGSSELRSIAFELDAFTELMNELLEKIDHTSERMVTKRELTRDFRFTPSSLRLLRKNGLLVPSRTDSKQRELYDLRKALKTRLLQAGLLTQPTIRTVRKHTNIISVYKDVLNKATEPKSKRLTHARSHDLSSSADSKVGRSCPDSATPRIP